MGTRLGIIEKKDYFYGTKLFGYVDARELESAKYLVQIGKINDEDLDFIYWQEMEIELSYIEFNKFVMLYNEDLNKFIEEKDWFINQQEIKELLDSSVEKILTWG